MRGVGRRLTAVAVVAVLGTVVWLGVAGPAPGSTRAETSLAVVPGLEEVTYGQTAAYVATILNTGGTTLKNVTFNNPIPTTLVDGEPQAALFQSSSCAGSLAATKFTCLAAATLRPGESATVTIAWKTPAAGSSPDCPGGEPCMKSSGSWTAGWKTFPMGPVATGLLSGTDESKAATYALSACTDPSNPTLVTNQALSADNPLATSICAPNLPVDPAHPGLVTAIEERDHAPSDPGVTQVSEICIPAPSFACDETPFVFSSLATFTFQILNSSLPQGEVIDKVFHDGVLVSTRPRDDPHVVNIKNQKYKGFTTVIVQSSTNGIWDFG